MTIFTTTTLPVSRSEAGWMTRQENVQAQPSCANLTNNFSNAITKGELVFAEDKGNLSVSLLIPIKKKSI